MTDRQDPIAELSVLAIALARNGHLSDAGLAELESCVDRVVGAFNELTDRLRAALVPNERWKVLDDRAFALYLELAAVSSLVDTRAFAHRLRRESCGDLPAARDQLHTLGEYLVAAASEHAAIGLVEVKRGAR